MAMVEIDSATLAKLRKDAKLARTVRRAVKNGAKPTLIRPRQSIHMMLDGVAPDDREPLQLAWTGAVSQNSRKPRG